MESTCNTNTNGVVYYKLQNKYEGDITKDASLSCCEVDGNFYFLRGYDIKSVEINENTNELLLHRVNGEDLKVVLSGGSVEDVSFDSETGILTVKNIGEEPVEYNGILTNNNICTGYGIAGKGTVDNPIRLTGANKVGKLAPADEYLDLRETSCGLSAEDGYGYPIGFRIVTKEFDDEDTNIVIKINEWDGEKWIKEQISDGETILIKKFKKDNEHPVLYHEYLVYRVSAIEYDIKDTISQVLNGINTLNERTDLLEAAMLTANTRIEALESELSSANQKIDDLVNGFEDRMKRYLVKFIQGYPTNIKVVKCDYSGNQTQVFDEIDHVEIKFDDNTIFMADNE